MKKIVPFNKVLKFDREVSEISSISLEHNLVDKSDAVSGEFIISGSYISNDNAMDNLEFKFNLPFDIALGVNYKEDTMIVDIDDFRYELISPDKLKVDIDLYIDGEEFIPEDVREDITDDIKTITINNIDRDEVKIENSNDNDNININANTSNNIFSPFLDEESYVTYRVYTVMEGDTIDSILEKYNISMEEIMKYNDISNLKPMDKLIIPSDEK